MKLRLDSFFQHSGSFWCAKHKQPQTPTPDPDAPSFNVRLIFPDALCLIAKFTNSRQTILSLRGVCLYWNTVYTDHLLQQGTIFDVPYKIIHQWQTAHNRYDRDNYLTASSDTEKFILLSADGKFAYRSHYKWWEGGAQMEETFRHTRGTWKWTTSRYNKGDLLIELTGKGTAQTLDNYHCHNYQHVLSVRSVDHQSWGGCETICLPMKSLGKRGQSALLSEVSNAPLFWMTLERDDVYVMKKWIEKIVKGNEDRSWDPETHISELFFELDEGVVLPSVVQRTQRDSIFFYGQAFRNLYSADLELDAINREQSYYSI